MRSTTLYTLSTALIAFVLATATGLADGSVRVIEETNTTIGLYDAKEFNITVTNDGFAPMTIYVLRSVNELPDANWFSTVCMAELCYAPEVSKTDPVVVQPGEEYKVKFTVYSGQEPSTGAFQLRVFEVKQSSEEELGVIDFSVTASGEASVPTGDAASLAVYPSPASATITIDGIDPVAGASIIEILDATGRTVASEMITVGTGSTSLDVVRLPAGVYFFRISSGGSMQVGRFVIAR